MLVDSFGRSVDYLRVSVIEQCNFRCQYCMPDTPQDYTKKENLISVDELFLFIKVGIDNGIKKIRITGGEPLLRDDIHKLIFKIKNYKESVDIALTTNAFFLKSYAKKLYDSGLKRVNVSLDTLKKEKQILISKKDVLDEVIEGIKEAKRVGLGVKINMVPLSGVNDDEICDLLEFARELKSPIRYIEFMENENAHDGVVGLRSSKIEEIISKRYSFVEEKKEFFGPAKLYRLDDGYIFGIIEPHSDNFCDSCNRVRFSADGFLIPCLYFEDAIDLKAILKRGDEREIRDVLMHVVKIKPEKNRWGELESSTRAFYKTGG